MRWIESRYARASWNKAEEERRRRRGARAAAISESLVGLQVAGSRAAP